MTQRERFLAALKGEKTDRVPWYGDLIYYYFSLEQDGKLEDKYKGDAGAAESDQPGALNALPSAQPVTQQQGGGPTQ